MEMAGAKFDEYEGNIKAMVVKEGLMMVRAALSVSCLCRSPSVVLSTANRRKRAATAHPCGMHGCDHGSEPRTRRSRANRS